jgi:hypothetical protein
MKTEMSRGGLPGVSVVGAKIRSAKYGAKRRNLQLQAVKRVMVSWPSAAAVSLVNATKAGSFGHSPEGKRGLG